MEASCVRNLLGIVWLSEDVPSIRSCAEGVRKTVRYLSEKGVQLWKCAWLLPAHRPEAVPSMVILQFSGISDIRNITTQEYRFLDVWESQHDEQKLRITCWIRRPLGWGANRLRRISSILYLGSSVLKRSYRSPDFSYFRNLHPAYPFIPAGWILYSACWRATPYCLVTAAQEATNYPQPAMVPQLGAPAESHRKSSNFEPISKAPQVMKIGPKAIKKFNCTDANMCEKSFFATHLTPISWFWNPRHPDADPEIIKNVTCKQCKHA